MNDRTLHTLIAALRFWQLHEGTHPSPLVDVASNDGEVDPLSSEEIDDLIENYLNADGANPVTAIGAELVQDAGTVMVSPPTLVVTLSEGGITNLQSSTAMRVVTLEYGAPDAELYEETGVDGEDCIVREHSLSRHVVGGSFAIDPDRVMSVIGQLSASTPA
jgi:hypothetical protein